MHHEMAVQYAYPGDLGSLIVVCRPCRWHWHIERREDAEGEFMSHVAPEDFQPIGIQLAHQFLAVIAKLAGYTAGDLIGPSRRRPLVTVRQMAMYILSRDCHLNYSEIGRLLDHDQSTITHGVRSFQKRINTDPEWQRQLETTRALLATMYDLAPAKA